MAPDAPQEPQQAVEQTPKIKTVLAGREIVQRVELQTPGAWADVLVNPRAARIRELNDASGNLMAYLIRAWNFGDENGNVHPISEETVNSFLSSADEVIIANKSGLSQTMDLAKKNS